MEQTNLSSLRIFAHFYHSMGFNVTCISNIENDYNYFSASLMKAPTHNWEHLITNKQTLNELNSYDWESATGIGCVLGFNNLRCIDIDGITDLSIVNEILISLNLPTDYEWCFLTGSGRGVHIYIDANQHDFEISKGQTKWFFPNKQYKDKFKVLELRWKYHCVLPPSLHQSLNNYTFLNGIPKGMPSRKMNGTIDNMIDSFCEHNFGAIYLDEEFVYGVSKVYFLNTKNGGYSIKEFDETKLNERKFLVFDTETNGLPINYNSPHKNPNNWPKLIQIAWYVFGENANFITKEVIVIKPEGFVIGPVISKLTGINQEYALKHGVSVKQALDLFFDAIKNVSYIVAHNLEFDENVILAECLRANRSFPLNEPDFITRKICTMKSSKDFCDLPKQKFPKLGELYEKLFLKEIEVEHNALSDAKIAAKCFWELLWREVIKIT